MNRGFTSYPHANEMSMQSSIQHPYPNTSNHAQFGNFDNQQQMFQSFANPVQTENQESEEFV